LPVKRRSFPWCCDRAQGTEVEEDAFCCFYVNSRQSASKGSLLLLQLVLLSTAGEVLLVVWASIGRQRMFLAAVKLPEQTSTAEGCLLLLLLLKQQV